MSEKYKTVPVEPTAEMLEAYCGAQPSNIAVYLSDGVEPYKAMLAAAPDHIADTRKMVASDVQGEPEGVRSLLVECERALCCPDPAQRHVTASKVLRMLAASTAPAVHGEPAAYISHTSEGDILGWERQFDAPSHTPLYAAPQPAEQQPDVTQLVEALTELCDEIDKHDHAAISKTSISWFKRKARAVLAAHRKQKENK